MYRASSLQSTNAPPTLAASSGPRQNASVRSQLAGTPVRRMTPLARTTFLSTTPGLSIDFSLNSPLQLPRKTNEVEAAKTPVQQARKDVYFPYDPEMQSTPFVYHAKVPCRNNESMDTDKENQIATLTPAKTTRSATNPRIGETDSLLDLSALSASVPETIQT
jgi:hypothetical protein